MSIISVNGSVEYNVGVRPSTILINTDDGLAAVMTEGYLDGETSVTYSDDLLAIVNTTEGVIELAVSTANEHVSLIAPLSVPV